MTVNVSIEQPLKPENLRLQKDGNFTRIYLGKLLVFVVYHYSKERSENEEDFQLRGGYYITELGLAEVIIKQKMNNRRFVKHKAAIGFCLAALKCFRDKLNMAGF